MTFENTLLCT